MQREKFSSEANSFAVWQKSTLTLQPGEDLILKYCKLNFIEFMIIEGYISSNYIVFL